MSNCKIRKSEKSELFTQVLQGNTSEFVQILQDTVFGDVESDILSDG